MTGNYTITLYNLVDRNRNLTLEIMILVGRSFLVLLVRTLCGNVLSFCSIIVPSHLLQCKTLVLTVADTLWHGGIKQSQVLRQKKISRIIKCFYKPVLCVKIKLRQDMSPWSFPAHLPPRGPGGARVAV